MLTDRVHLLLFVIACVYVVIDSVVLVDTSPNTVTYTVTNDDGVSRARASALVLTEIAS
jgi:hypothetical protein